MPVAFTRTRGIPLHLRAISSGGSRQGFPIPTIPATTPMLRISGARTRRRSSSSATSSANPEKERPGRMTSTLGSARTFWNQWVLRPKPAMQ